jgi:hypothetical protein
MSSNTKVLKGLNSRPDNILEEDIISDFALVPQMYNGEFWLDGRYNMEDYKVSQGSIITEMESFTAYQVFPATKKAELTLIATEQEIYYRFPEIADYTIYIYDDNDYTFTHYKFVPKNEVVYNGFTHIRVSNQAFVRKPTIYAFIKGNVDLSRLNNMGNGVTGAVVHNDYTYKVLVHSYKLADTFVEYFDSQWGIDDEQN